MAGDSQLFPFLPQGFGGNSFTGYVNDASSEAAIEIIHEGLRNLRTSERVTDPDTRVADVFQTDEVVSDQLQSLLMAAYQRAVLDITIGNLKIPFGATGLIAQTNKDV